MLILVAIDIAVSDSKWINIILAGRGLTQSLYNLESGKRHFVRYHHHYHYHHI